MTRLWPSPESLANDIDEYSRSEQQSTQERCVLEGHSELSSLDKIREHSESGGTEKKPNQLNNEGRGRLPPSIHPGGQIL